MCTAIAYISRIREEWRAGAPDSDAVAGGLAKTGRIITSAAAIMICVFAAFVLGDLRVLAHGRDARRAAARRPRELVVPAPPRARRPEHPLGSSARSLTGQQGPATAAASCAQ
jgi:hypothetical protein